MFDTQTLAGSAKVVDGQMTPSLMESRNLGYTSNGRDLIRGVDIGLQKGQRTVIMGANGSGKSLLLRLMHGLLTPTCGDILWQGRPLNRAARDAQALVFQKPVMLRRSVLANLRFALSVRGIGGREQVRRAADAVEMARLGDLAHRPARVLSGGEQQRLAIARALICEPELLMLDEPTASLDPASTAMVEDQINTAHAAGVTIVLVTHDSGQARRVGDRICFLHAGQIVEHGPAQQVLTNPRSEPARAWFEGRLFFDEPQRPNA
jgi:tungstate transport system ATP-binding protein